MSRIFMLLLGMSMICGFSYAQSDILFKGTVVNQNKRPLLGASVLLHPINRGSITDAKGHFHLDQLSAGNYELEISYIGYKTLHETISLDGDKTRTFQLAYSPLSLQEITVLDSYAETRKKEETLNIEVVNDDYLKQNMGGSVMNSLERLPGVSTIEIGSGQSKPVIRGLGFNRVLVLENNVKHESQQWGSDHGLEIDQYAIDHIEVIKGPASLMYGSDAIGGIIDMKNKTVPLDNSLGGTLDLTGKTNNDFLGTSLSIYGRKKWFFASLRGTLTAYSDYKVPTDSIDIYSYRAALQDNHLRNTAGNEANAHLTFGTIQERFQSRFYLSTVNNKSGFFANAHGLEPREVDTLVHDSSNRDIQFPYQKVNHMKLSNTTIYRWDKLTLETDLGFQSNTREEWSEYVQHGYMPATPPSDLDFDPDLERQFDKKVFSGNVKLNYHSSEKTQYNFGLNGEYQDNQIDGRGFIIPTFQQLYVGGFTFVKHQITDKSMLQAGIRYDYGEMNTEEYYDWFTSPVDENNPSIQDYLQRADKINRNFSNFTWSLGYNYNPGKWSYKANLGKSFRMPIAKELAANGVNYHHFSFEVGNPDLSPEISYQLDLGFEYQTKKFAIGTTPFFNYFSNYIYLNPTSNHDRLYGNGNQEFDYTESEVLRYGGELHAHYELFDPLQLGFVAEYVYSEQLSGEKKGYTLPFSPPASAIINVKYQRRRLKFIENAYLSLDYRLTAAQNNIVPPEKTSDGYQVINLGFGGNVFFSKQQVNISMQVQNLLNTKYFNHTSYYRLINVPEAGRNFIVTISIPFSGKIKHE